MRTALSAWLSGVNKPLEGGAIHSRPPRAAYNEDGTPEVAVSWEDWQRAYDHAKRAESSSRSSEIAKGAGHAKHADRSDQKPRQEPWDWQSRQPGPHSGGQSQGVIGGPGSWEDWGRRGEERQREGQWRPGVGAVPAAGDGGGESAWESRHAPSAPPVWEMTGALANMGAQHVPPSIRGWESASEGPQEQRAQLGDGGGTGGRRAGVGAMAAIGGLMGGEVTIGGGRVRGCDAVVGGNGGGSNVAEVEGRRGGGSGVVGAVRECVAVDWVPERLLVKFQQRVALYRIGFNFQFRHSHHTPASIPSAMPPLASPSTPPATWHTLAPARGTSQSHPLISVGPYQAYPSDVKVVIKPSTPTPPSKAAPKLPAPASTAARLASTAASIARAAVGGGKLQLMPLAGTVQVVSGRVGLLGLADAQVHLSHHWPSSSSQLRFLLHSPFSSAHTCACSSSSSSRHPRASSSYGSTTHGREVQPGAANGAALHGGSSRSSSHLNASSFVSLDSCGYARGGVSASPATSAGEGGVSSAGRSVMEQQGIGAAGSSSGGVVQVARAKACLPMWHGMDVRLTGCLRYSMPWYIGTYSRYFASSSLAMSLGSFHLAVDKVETIFSL
ncbi:hypothetical protein CLOM_g9631 [Closterium sp. NIES-68]|nr:hypothetical protein CLOM_g9631 [Closterium sp. NIES-68]GJP57749.1 hypothetical protein CLOP_g17314 [Closterium sp. NIES-67]